ncbi:MULTISPECIES: hypothetical protein [Flavobacteriaceae]|jgi:hypothetical protein|uniref:Uncharacterized protein n=1 Tax=Olleya marilimosa TaxID=272164 RepID=A0ABR8LU87_9FLAO|nr:MULTISPECIES: hypothetical protein [Flavobacteriaceae]MBD3863395.1 hypothetical protein [Olleya marilimosa]|tara:strand:- start:2247 stop:2648 length:402 start_codon:yes stop_codon:yes gene_type:complete
MDRYTYNCNYCGVEYTPKRRYKQKYCSNSCRVNAFTKRKKVTRNLPTKENQEKPSTINKMSWSGVGNAAVGTLATNIVTNIFTKEENKPATKGDIKKLINKTHQGVILIKNLPPRYDGTRAYFDTAQQILIYK